MTDDRVPLDDPRLTHLLGYLTPDQWREAKSFVDKSFLDELMGIQERAYRFELKKDVYK
jgi:hypothetical protein